MPTGGDALVAALQALDVEVAFGLPGVHNLAAWKAFPGSGVRLVGVRHEQTAGYAADGWARATGRLGVALTTTGPGAANVVAATGEAWSCHSPLLVIATDIPSTVRRPGAFRGVLHETTDQAGFFRPVTKAVVRVERAEDVYGEVLRAGRIAMTAPRRPVYVEVPTDFLSASVPSAEPVLRATTQELRTVLVDDAVKLLAGAQRPLVWAGGGAVYAADVVARLAEQLGAPVLTSYGGRGVLPPDHPCAVALPPHEPAVGALWDDADVVLCLGSDLDAMNTQGFRQPQPPALVTVDLVEPVNYPPDVWVRADVGEAATALLGALPDAPRGRWADAPRGRTHLSGAETDLLDQLEAALPDDAVVVADMCVAGYWYGAYGRVTRPRALAYPVGWGTLGFGFPAALGAAATGRPTVALVGDGGFLFACGDLATAAQERLPVTVVLVDDGGYGMLAYDFRKDGETPIGCDLEPPDFVALAQAFRVHAERVEPADVGAALTRHLALDAPSMIVVPAALTPPPNTSPRWYRAAVS